MVIVITVVETVWNWIVVAQHIYMFEITREVDVFTAKFKCGL